MEHKITKKSSGRSLKEPIFKKEDRKSQLYSLLLAAVVFLFPFFSTALLKDPFDTPKIIILFLTVPLFWLLYFLIESRVELGLPEICLLAFGGLSLASGVINYFVADGYQLKFIFGNLRQSLSPVVLFVSAFYFLALKQVKKRKLLESSFSLGFLALSLAALYQFFMLDEASAFQGRTFVSAGNPVYLGAVLSIGASFLLYARSVSPSLKWTSLILTGAALGTTQSRVAMLALVLAVIFYVIVNRKPGFTLLAAASGLFPILFFLYSGWHRLVRLRADLMERVDLYLAGMKALVKRPFLGNGYASFETYFRKLELSKKYLNRIGEVPDSSHSALLDLAFHYGLLPAFVLLGFLLMLLFQFPAFGLVSLLVFLFSPLTISVWLVFLTSAALLLPDNPVLKVEFKGFLRWAVVAVALLFTLAGIFSSYKMAASGYYAKLSFDKLHAGKLTEAFELLDKASGYMPQEPEFLLEKARLLARTAMFNGELTGREMLKEAVESLDRVFAIDPFNFEAYILKADILSLTSSVQAVEAARTAVYLSPYDAHAYYYLGLAKAAQSDLKGAVWSWKKAIQLKKDYAEAYFSLGYAHEIMKDYRNARKYYEQALKYAGEKDRQIIKERLKGLVKKKQ